MPHTRIDSAADDDHSNGGGQIGRATVSATDGR
jgi:hypothetical protein